MEENSETLYVMKSIQERLREKVSQLAEAGTVRNGFKNFHKCEKRGC